MLKNTIKQSIQNIHSIESANIDELVTSVESNVALRLVDILSEKDIEYMERLSDDGVALFLTGKVPNLTEIIDEEIEKMKMV